MPGASASSSGEASRRKSSGLAASRPGNVIAGRLACDEWKREPGRLHFLSHAHADHIAGLGPLFDRPIYTSQTTARLLNLLEPKVRKSLLRPLDLWTPTDLPYPSGAPGSVRVTLLEADHCPGAVMFLFEGAEMGRVLYTGDFRYEATSPTWAHSVYGRLFDGLPLDAVYADFTYAKDGHEVEPIEELPSRAQLTDDIVEAVTKELREQPTSKVLVSTYRLGKEELLRRLVEETGERLGADPERAAVLRLSGALTAEQMLPMEEPGKGRWRLATHQQKDLRRAANQHSRHSRLLVVVPSGLVVARPGAFNYTKQKRGERIRYLQVPLSDHCSARELGDFLKRLSIRSLFTIGEQYRTPMLTKLIASYVNLPPRDLHDAPPLASAQPSPSAKDQAQPTSPRSTRPSTKKTMRGGGTSQEPGTSAATLARDKAELEREASGMPVGGCRTPRRKRRLHDPREFTDGRQAEWDSDDSCVILDDPTPAHLALAQFEEEELPAVLRPSPKDPKRAASLPPDARPPLLTPVPPRPCQSQPTATLPHSPKHKAPEHKAPEHKAPEPDGHEPRPSRSSQSSKVPSPAKVPSPCKIRSTSKVVPSPSQPKRKAPMARKSIRRKAPTIVTVDLTDSPVAVLEEEEEEEGVPGPSRKAAGRDGDGGKAEDTFRSLLAAADLPFYQSP